MNKEDLSKWIEKQKTIINGEIVNFEIVWYICHEKKPVDGMSYVVALDLDYEMLSSNGYPEMRRAIPTNEIVRPS